MLPELASVSAYFLADIRVPLDGLTIAIVVFAVLTFVFLGIKSALKAEPSDEPRIVPTSMKDFAVVLMHITEQRIGWYTRSYRVSVAAIMVLTAIQVSSAAVLTSPSARASINAGFIQFLGILVLIAATTRDSFDLLRIKKRARSKRNTLARALLHAQELMAAALTSRNPERLHHRVVRHLTRTLSSCDDEKEDDDHEQRPPKQVSGA